MRFTTSKLWASLARFVENVEAKRQPFSVRLPEGSRKSSTYTLWNCACSISCARLFAAFLRFLSALGHDEYQMQRDTINTNAPRITEPWKRKNPVGESDSFR